MVFETITSISLSFLAFLAFVLPIYGAEEGLRWWRSRNIYHMIIFTTGGLVPLIIRTVSSALITLGSFIALLLLYYSLSGENAINRFYEIMRREGVTPSERSIYTATTLVLLFILVIGLWNTPVYFTIGMLVIAMSDSMGELVGRTVGEVEYKVTSNKTVKGSLTVFFTSTLVIFVTLFAGDLLDNYSLMYLIIIAGVITLAEALSFKFLDNVLIPYFTALALRFPIFDIF